MTGMARISPCRAQKPPALPGRTSPPLAARPQRPGTNTEQAVGGRSTVIVSSLRLSLLGRTLRLARWLWQPVASLNDSGLAREWTAYSESASKTGTCQ